MLFARRDIAHNLIQSKLLMRMYEATVLKLKKAYNNRVLVWLRKKPHFLARKLYAWTTSGECSDRQVPGYIFLPKHVLSFVKLVGGYVSEENTIVFYYILKKDGNEASF